MDHPVQEIARGTKFLDGLIRERGDSPFIGVGFTCLFLIAWIRARGHERPAQGIPVVILPLGQPPRYEPARHPLSSEAGFEL
jgi:hypothetical protein